jgi:subtilisin family serine protease
LNINHVDFEGRARWGWSAFQGESPYGGGHGTHVAGTIGGSHFGVAKKTKIIAVQVLNSEGRGAVSGFLAGLQWVADHRSKNGRGRAVINMSLGANTYGMPSQALAAFNQAISAVVNEGIPIIAAAGNEDTDACNVLPAANRDVFTVAASGVDDDMSDYSNYGRCVQIIAPGTNIKSAYIGSTTSTAVMSGTSMASPHVCGVAALLMTDLRNPSPANLYRELAKLATRNVISRVKRSTPNILLFNGAQ